VTFSLLFLTASPSLSFSVQCPKLHCGKKCLDLNSDVLQSEIQFLKDNKNLYQTIRWFLSNIPPVFGSQKIHVLCSLCHRPLYFTVLYLRCGGGKISVLPVISKTKEKQQQQKRRDKAGKQIYNLLPKCTCCVTSGQVSRWMVSTWTLSQISL